MGDQPWPGSPMWNAAVDKVGEVLAEGVEARVAKAEARLAQAEAKLARKDEALERLLRFMRSEWIPEIQDEARAALLDQEDSGEARAAKGECFCVEPPPPHPDCPVHGESDPETRKEGSDG